MKSSTKVSIAFVLLAICTLTNAFGGDEFSQETGRRHQGPPPEAYTACECKKAGDAAEFVTPRGDTVTGTCEQEGDRLVLRPDHPPREDSDGRAGNKTGD